MIQTPRNGQKGGSCAAMSPGGRRMPGPIMLPSVTARPNVTPRTVSSFARGKNVSVADAENGVAVRHRFERETQEVQLVRPRRGEVCTDRDCRRTVAPS